MCRVDIIPKRQTKSPEIRTNRACLRVATTEWLPPEKLGSHESLQGRSASDDHVVYTFGVEVPAKALELG